MLFRQIVIIIPIIIITVIIVIIPKVKYLLGQNITEKWKVWFDIISDI